MKNQQSIQIGIDISSVVYGRGVSNYTDSLVLSLLKNYADQIWLYGCNWGRAKQMKLAAQAYLSAGLAKSHLKLQALPIKLLEQLWSFGLNQVHLQLPGIQVFHSWDWLQPPDQKLALVSTIHDLAILKYPQTVHPEVLAKHRRSWDILKKRSAHLIAVSEATKMDMINLLDFDSSKITVIKEALPLNRQPQGLSDSQLESVKQKFSLIRPFLLFVGSREPRKNLLRLIEAWSSFESDFDLVIAGEAAWDQVVEKLSQNQTAGLKFLGRVSDQELAALYQSAVMFCYPSLDEGFGLPILEAFAHACPVLTSHHGATKETAGEAAILVDPLEVASIKAGIQQILDLNSDQKQALLSRMRQQLSQFSWDKTAQETWNVYNLAAQSK